MEENCRESQDCTRVVALIKKKRTAVHLNYISNLICLKEKKGNGKGTAIPLQAWTGLEGSRMLRLSDFKTICT
jgi:hypothetical protein